MANIKPIVLLFALATVLLTVEGEILRKCKTGCVDKGTCPENTLEMEDHPNHPCPTKKENKVCCVQKPATGFGNPCDEKHGGQCVAKGECKGKQKDDVECAMPGQTCCVPKGGPGKECAALKGECVLEPVCTAQKGDVHPKGCDMKGHICCRHNEKF